MSFPLSSLLFEDAGTAFRFIVAIDGVYTATFSEFNLPSLDVDTDTITEGGQNAFIHQLPIRTKVGNATLKHGVADNLILLYWYMQVMDGDMQNARREVSVLLYGADLYPMMVWSFRNAFPIKWSGPTFKADDSTVAFEELEFVHHGFTIETTNWSHFGEIGS